MDERTRNNEHTRQAFGDFTSGSFDPQRMKERRITNIRVKSLVVLLVTRLTRQRMKERGIMDVRVYS